jgi:hypothetical protein
VLREPSKVLDPSSLPLHEEFLRASYADEHSEVIPRGKHPARFNEPIGISPKMS